MFKNQPCIFGELLFSRIYEFQTFGPFKVFTLVKLQMASFLNNSPKKFVIGQNLVYLEPPPKSL